jgi:GT2 family glycosyltransferase/glycosyltransferase involved in cell wall biosynthesis
LFIDNGSTDNTAEIVDRYAQQKSLPLRYVVEPRRGKSHALNRGVEEAASDFLLFTDDDITLDPAWFAAGIKASERQSYGMFGGRVIAVLPPAMPPWLLDRNNRPILTGPLVTHDHGDDEREYTDSMVKPIGANMFVRRKLFEKHGLFRTDLGPLERGGVYCEDIELAFRFILAGERVLYYPKAIVYHPILQDRLRKLFFHRYFFNCGKGWARFVDPPAGTVRYRNIPRYQLRRALTTLSTFVLSDVFLPPGERFLRKVQLLFLFGTIAEYYSGRERLAPSPVAKPHEIARPAPKSVAIPLRSAEGPLFPSIGVIGLVPDVWGDYWQARQHVLTRLARYFFVVWVDSARSLPGGDHDSRTHEGIDEGAGIAGFHVYRPPFRLSRMCRPGLLADFFFDLRLRQARKILKKRGCSKVITYIWRPEYERALSSLPGTLSCYHIDDEYTFSEEEVPTDLVETRLIKRVDQVFVHSQGLFEKKGGLNPRTMVVPNGVDYDAYALPRAEPDDLRSVPKPRIGYTGILKTQLDWPLLLQLARRHSEWSFVFVGPRNGSQAEVLQWMETLSALPNVYFLGGKSSRLLASYPQHFDAAVMPYRVNSYTNHIYPLKLHEYLASGCPVVGSKIRSLFQLQDVVRLAGTADEWSAALSDALSPSARSITEVEKRRTVARDHDWNRIVHTIALTLCTLAEPGSARLLEGVSERQC